MVRRCLVLVPGPSSLPVQFAVDELQGCLDGVVHVGVGVLRQPSAEEHVHAVVRQGAVAFIQCRVAGVVHGVVRLLAGSEVVRILIGDDGRRLCAEGEMLVLDDACVGDLALGVVDHGVALEVVGVFEHPVVEAQAAVLQPSEAVLEVLVDAAGEEGGVRQLVQFVAVGEVVGAQAHLAAFEQGVDEAVVPTLGDALVAVVEVVVVKGEAEGQTADDEGRQFGGGTSPLLLGIALDEFFVDVLTHEQHRLFL